MLEELLSQEYQNDNYKIEILGTQKTCCIFCSSNGLWNYSEDDFVRKIVNQNYYEWSNIAKHPKMRAKYGKYIFLRDIYLHFYVDGINNRINSIDKIIELLRSYTEGYEITIVGNSSGGYIAMLLGNALRAKNVFSIGGQFNLYSWRGGKNNLKFEDFRFLVEQQDIRCKEKYYDIRPLLESNVTNIYHFYAGRNDADKSQADSARFLSCVKLFPMNVDTHGDAIYGFNYPFLLTVNNSRLARIKISSGQLISKVEFSVKLIGFFKTMLFIANRFLRRFVRK